MEWFCTTSFRSDVFQMGLLSALEQFLCSRPPPSKRTHTQTHTPSSFSSLYSHAEQQGEKKKNKVKEELMSVAELRATSAVSDSRSF